jgi:hypothetical protein
VLEVWQHHNTSIGGMVTLMMEPLTTVHGWTTVTVNGMITHVGVRALTSYVRTSKDDKKQLLENSIQAEQISEFPSPLADTGYCTYHSSR